MIRLILGDWVGWAIFTALGAFFIAALLETGARHAWVKISKR